MLKKRICAVVACVSFVFIITGCSNNNDHPDTGFVKTIGGEGDVAGKFISPESIAVDKSGNLYIVDSFNDRIQKFNSEGIQILSWGSSGVADGQFMGCRGIALDSTDHVYVTDVILHRVQKFDSSGNFITKWGSEGTGDGQFSAPFDIAADSSDHLYVVDSMNHRIQKFDSSGVFLGSFGTKGTRNGQFDEPAGIAIDREDTIYIGDGNNNRIQKFDRAMQFIDGWGQAGTGDGQFDIPYSIATDSIGNVYVVDIGNNRIQKFDSAGRFLGKAGREGVLEVEFQEPTDVAFDQTGNLYAVDNSNHRIQLLTQAIFSVPSAVASPIPGLATASTGAAPTASWMRDLASNTSRFSSTPLTLMAIPGTHDSATYGIDSSSDMADDGNVNGPEKVTDFTGKVSHWCHSTGWTPHWLCSAIDDVIDHDINPIATNIVKSVQAPWCKSQDQTILQQLNGGIRFLDLRVQGYNGGAFRIVHSMVSVSMNQVLDDIAAFCKQSESSREIIVVSLRNYKMTPDLDDKLISLIKTKLVNAQGESLLIPRSDLSTVTLNGIWSTPGRVMVFYADSPYDKSIVETHPELWFKNPGDGNAVDGPGTLVSYYPNTNTTVGLVEGLQGARNGFLANYGANSSKYFYVSQLIRTQDATAIVEGIGAKVFDVFGRKLGSVGRYLFKKGWKALHLPTVNLEGDLLGWGTDTNALMPSFFKAMGVRRQSGMLNIVIVDHYESVPTDIMPFDFVQEIISHNANRYYDDGN